MKLRIINLFALLGMLSLFFTSCIKDNVNELTDEGSTFLNIIEAPSKQFYFEPFQGTRTFDVLSLRKDAAKSSDLNTTASVKLQLNKAILDTFNARNGSDYQMLPDSLFTVGQSVQRSGNTFTFNFAPGEFAKELSITLNGSKWNIINKYALPFRILDSAGLNIKEGAQEFIALISVKNKYDAAYEMTGNMVDNVNSALTGLYPSEIHMVTTGPSSVVMYDPVIWHDYFHPINNSGTPSGYGSFAPEFHFDDNGNITRVVNYYGQPAGNGRSAALDPSGVNKFDEATKTIKVKYFMLQPGTTVRTSFDETFTYKGPRP